MGEDPLRPHKDNRENQIILSTPYAPQFEHYREHKGKLYWNFSLYFLERGYTVYYTDINKIWVCERNKIKLRIPNDLSEHFKQSLMLEIETNQSECIITFGKWAEKAAKETVPDNKILSFIHPSFMARKYWKKKYKYESKPISDEEMLNIMKEEFEEKIKQ